MAQYLIAIYRPDDYDPSLEDEAMGRDIDVLNDEMKAAGVPRSTWAVFGCWEPLTWTRRWRGGVRPPSPVGRRSRCARFAGGGPDGSN